MEFTKLTNNLTNKYVRLEVPTPVRAASGVVPSKDDEGTLAESRTKDLRARKQSKAGTVKTRPSVTEGEPIIKKSGGPGTRGAGATAFLVQDLGVSLEIARKLFESHPRLASALERAAKDAIPLFPSGKLLKLTENDALKLVRFLAKEVDEAAAACKLVCMYPDKQGMQPLGLILRYVREGSVQLTPKDEVALSKALKRTARSPCVDGRWDKLRKLYDWCPEEWRPVLLGRGVLQAPLQANGAAVFLWSLRKENLDWETIFAFGVERAAKRNEPRLLADAARLVSAFWGMEEHSSIATVLNQVLHLTLVAMTPQPTVEDYAFINGLLPKGVPLGPQLEPLPKLEPLPRLEPPPSHIAAAKQLENETGIKLYGTGQARWIWPDTPWRGWMTAVLQYLAHETSLGAAWAAQADCLCEVAFSKYASEGEFPIAALVDLAKSPEGLALLNKPPKWLLEYFEIGFVKQLQKISSAQKPDAQQLEDLMNSIGKLGCTVFTNGLLEIQSELFDLASANQLTGVLDKLMKFGPSSCRSKTVYGFVAELADLAKALKSGSLDRMTLAARLNKIVKLGGVHADSRRLSRTVYNFMARLEDLANEITERARKIEKHSKIVANQPKVWEITKKNDNFQKTAGIYEEIATVPDPSQENLASLIEFADILLLPGPDENDPLSQGLRAVHDCILAELNSFAVELKNGLDPVTLVDKLKRLSALGRNIFADTYIWHGVEEFADIAERLQANIPMEQATVEVDALIEKNVRYQFGWVFKLRTLSDESKWLNYSSEFRKRIKAEFDGPIAHHFGEFRKKLATAVPAAFLGMAEQILMRAAKEASLELSERLARAGRAIYFSDLPIGLG